MSTGLLIWLFTVVSAVSPGVMIEDSPLCQIPLGADRAWLAAQGESETFELPPYAVWTEDYPNYGMALSFLEDLSAGRDVLGFFTDHRLRRVGFVVDPSFSEPQLETLTTEIEAGYPTQAPPVEIHRACFPLQQTYRVVDALDDGDWHPLLGSTRSEQGADWSVLAWPEMGGYVEVWISEPLPDVDQHLRSAVGEDVELVRLVIGDDLSKGWAGARPVDTSSDMNGPTTSLNQAEELNSLGTTPINGIPSESDSGNAAIPVTSWLVVGLCTLGLGTWILRRRSRRSSP